MESFEDVIRAKFEIVSFETSTQEYSWCSTSAHMISMKKTYNTKHMVKDLFLEAQSFYGKFVPGAIHAEDNDTITCVVLFCPFPSEEAIVES